MFARLAGRFRAGPRALSALVAVPALLAVSACAHAPSRLDVEGGSALDPEREVVILPFLNASQAPLAGERAQAVLTTLLRRRGIGDLRIAADLDPEDAPPELDDRRRYQRALSAVLTRGAGWGVTGTVVEWRYRPGLRDEPAVSISLRIVDLADGRVVWSGSGARGGTGTVGVVAQELLGDLVRAMPLGSGG